MDISRTADTALQTALRTSSGLSQAEQDSLSGLTGDDYKRAYAQLMLQKQQEVVSFVTNILKNNQIMQVIGNLK